MDLHLTVLGMRGYENAASNLLSEVKTWSTAVSFSLTNWDVLFDDAMPSINSRLIMEHHTGTLDWMCEHWMEIFWIVVPADSKSCYTLPQYIACQSKIHFSPLLQSKRGVSTVFDLHNEIGIELTEVSNHHPLSGFLY